MLGVGREYIWRPYNSDYSIMGNEYIDLSDEKVIRLRYMSKVGSFQIQ